MPVQVSYPGVYIQEIPSGNRTITGVGTAIAAFVGRALRGPVEEPTPIGSFAEFERVFGGLWRSSGLGYAIRDFYLNGGSSALVVRLLGGATSAIFDVDGLGLSAASPGLWGNVPQADVTHPAPDDAKAVADAQGVQPDDLFHLTVREGDRDSGGPSESFFNVTTADGPRRVDVVLRASQLVDVTGSPPAHRPAASDADHPYKVAEVDYGSDGDALVLQEYVSGTFETDKKGLYALLKADLFTLLCVPPSGPAGDLPDDLWSAALHLCQDHRAFLLVDPPGTQTLSSIPTWLAGLGLNGPIRRNAAVYFPRISSPDPLRGGAIGDFVPCGAVAGVMARTDATRGVWKAPAGIDAGVGGALGLTTATSDDVSGVLNPQGVNVLRTFPGVGMVVWGARTLAGSDVLQSDSKYVPVRRLTDYISASLYLGTQFAVFEPNDPDLHAQLRLAVGSFMRGLFRQGAFQQSESRAESDSFFVICDATVNPQSEIDLGRVNVVVGFAPLKPAEFVIVTITQISNLEA